MKKSEVVSFSLPPQDVAVLDGLAKEAGSRSAAVRLLIERERKARFERELDEAYREYYSDPQNVKADSELTEEMMVLSSWLGYKPKGGKRGGKKRSAR